MAFFSFSAPCTTSGLNGLTMEGASTSETSANFYTTIQRNNPEDRHVRTYCRENLKSPDFRLLRSRLKVKER
jgi:hypothetical protein